MNFAFARFRPRRPLSAALLLGAFALTGCLALQHALTPKIPPGLNLDFGMGEVWRRIPPIELTGVWVDADGGRVKIEEQGGIGTATVLTEDVKFFWTDGPIVVLNGTVTLERNLAGQKIDTLSGRILCDAIGGQVTLSVDFKDAGVWVRESGPVPLSGQWYHDGKEIKVEHVQGDQFKLTADPAIGWRGGTGTIGRKGASFTVDRVEGGRVPKMGKLSVGGAWTMQDLIRASEEANKAKQAGT